MVMKVVYGQFIFFVFGVYNLWIGIYMMNEFDLNVLIIVVGIKMYKFSVVDNWLNYYILVVS